MSDVERRFGDCFIADAASVHERLVRQVHQIVDNQPVIAFDVNCLAVSCPGWIVVPVHVRNQRRVGHCGIAHP